MLQSGVFQSFPRFAAIAGSIIKSNSAILRQKSDNVIRGVHDFCENTIL